MEKIIKYAIADDHKLFRKGIIAVLEDSPGFKLVLEAQNGRGTAHQHQQSKARRNFTRS
jgi:DNA-binding NarL/FixJ family response regulator